MALSCYDEALAIPTEKAQKIAVRTQQIIAEEIGVTDTIDPMAGSYYLEWLTDELERRAVEEMEKIEEMGGAVEAIDSGYYHKAILDEAYKWEQDVNEGERVVVGVNKYRDDDEPQPEYFQRRPDAGRAASARSSSGCAPSATRAAAEQALARLRDRRRGRREPDARDHRGRARLLHARRDLRRDARRLRRVQGACRDLTPAAGRGPSACRGSARPPGARHGAAFVVATLVAKLVGAGWGTAAAFGQMAFVAAVTWAIFTGERRSPPPRPASE